jgi:hypothetical protein
MTEKNTIKATFKNSVGCIKKGTQGIEIHQRAHLKAVHCIST